MSARPELPQGWTFIAPAEVREGDAVITDQGALITLGPDLLAPLPADLRRRSWAVRKAVRD